MPVEIEVQVQGLCRWSYPSEPGAFQREAGAEDAGLEGLRAQLYAPERLELRLFYLEHVMLPALRVQTDPDFTLHLLMGDQLPEPVKARILDLIREVPQINPVFAPEGQPHQEICRKVMLAGRREGRVVAEFRLDDDDAVAVDFIEQARGMFVKVRRIWRNGGKLALDFNRGFVLNTSGRGLDVMPVIARYWTPGLVLYLRPHEDHSLLDFAHAQMWKRIPMLSHPRQPMFIRGAHGGNDSTVSLRPHNAELEGEDADWNGVLDQLKERFAIDARALEHAWEAYRDRMRRAARAAGQGGC